MREINPGHNLRGNFREHVRRFGDSREIFLGHADHLVFALSRFNLHPMILKKFKFNFFVGQQAHELKQFLGRYGPAAFFFNFRFARSTDAQLEVGGGEGKFVADALEQKVRQNRDGRLAFDDALRHFQFF